MRRVLAARAALGRALAVLGAAAVLTAGPAAAVQDDYPTTEVADYVFGCMTANGQTRDALERCSCSIDVVRTLVPFQRYQEAETVLSMRQVQGGGEKMGLFRETAWAKALVDEVRRAQMEAEVRCF